MRLLDAANTPKALIGALVLFILLDGLLFYRYQLEKSSALIDLPSPPANLSSTTSNDDSKGEEQEPKREENKDRSGTVDNDEGNSAQDTIPEESSPTANGSPLQSAREPSGELSAPSAIATVETPSPPPPPAPKASPPAEASSPAAEGLSTTPPSAAEVSPPTANEPVPPAAEEPSPPATEVPPPLTGEPSPAT